MLFHQGAKHFKVILFFNSNFLYSIVIGSQSKLTAKIANVRISVRVIHLHTLRHMDICIQHMYSFTFIQLINCGSISQFRFDSSSIAPNIRPIDHFILSRRPYKSTNVKTREGYGIEAERIYCQTTIITFVSHFVVCSEIFAQ